MYKPRDRARRLAPVGIAAVMLASPALIAGCGDGPICASDITVIITNPDEGTLIEDTSTLPGLQTDVIVRSNLREGDLVELTMRDQFGWPSVWTAFADADGRAVFSTVDVPDGPVTMTATGYTDQCGTGEDEIFVDSFDASACTISVREPAILVPGYPALVLNRDADSNPVISDFQANIDIRARAGYEVELRLRDPVTGEEASGGARIADATGLARFTASLPQGWIGLRADCMSRTNGRNSTSDVLEFYIDTEAPACTLIRPLPAATLSPLDDLDSDPSNGTQIEFVAATDVSDDDLDPESAEFVLNGTSLPGSALDDAGQSRLVMTLSQNGVYDIGFTVRDFAGNSCQSGRDYNFGAAPFAVEVLDRRSLRATWVAPELIEGNETYVLKLATEPLTEDNFTDDSVGFVLATPQPSEPGTIESIVITALRPGTDYYLGLMLDGFLGSEYLGFLGPVGVDFTGTGAIGPLSPSEGDNALGYQMAPGDFNGDGLSDVAIAAPYKQGQAQDGVGGVYVYYGTPDGLSTSPGAFIEGSTFGAQFGNGLTALRWDDDDLDDLAIGAPLAAGLDGGVFVFRGGPGRITGTMRASQADVIISAGGGWFATGVLGFALTRARFDDDGRDDLIISAPGGGGGNGGLVVLYGGATATDIVLDDTDASGSGDAVALVLQDPDAGSIFDDPPGPFFGHYLYTLGRTEGAGDVNDDVGVAYTENSAAVVFRGRAKPAAPGVTMASFDAGRDLEVTRSSPDTQARFGTTMGSIADVDGDGSRDLVLGVWRDLANLGRVEIVSGSATGSHDVTELRITEILPPIGACPTEGCGLGSAIVNNATSLLDPDVDGDGLEDLLIVSGIGQGRMSMLVWYGGSIPTGQVFSDSADHEIAAPEAFEAGARGNSDGTPITATWIGDVNGDGLEDICWADSSASGRDGAFEVLYDRRTLQAIQP